MRPRSLVLLWAATAMLFAFPARATQSTLVDDVALLTRLKEEAVTWCQSIESIACTYNLQSNRYGSEGQASFATFTFHYRYQEDNIYLDQLYTNGPKEDMRIVHVRVDGRYDYRLVRDIQHTQAPGEASLAAPGGWPWPAGVWVMPHEIFAQNDGDTTLPEALEQGTLYLFETEEHYVLSSWCGAALPCREVDVWVGKYSEHIERIEWVYRLCQLPSEMAVLTPRPLLEAKCTARFFELSNYMEVDGIAVPLHVREGIMGSTQQKERMNELNAEGKITYQEYAAGILKDLENMSVLRVERLIDIDPASLQVNEPLPKKAFDLPLEVGDHYTDYRKSTKVAIVLPWFRQTWFFFVIAVAVIALLVGFFFAWQRR